VLAQKAADGQRQMLAHGRGIAAQPDLPGQAGAELAHGPAQELHLAEHLARMLAQGVARSRGLHAACLANEQRRAQKRLHAAHALAGRGQREMAALCRCRQRAAVEDVHKQLEVGQVKAHGIQA
jgi:hypothetical protein